jgi:hypothetical protein
MIETPWVWSPVTTISVSGLDLAKSWAAATALSNSIVSTRARSQSSGWDILSMEAPSTIRKKPSGFFERDDRAACIISTVPGWFGNCGTVPFLRNSRSRVTSMLAGWKIPRSLPELDSRAALLNSSFVVATAYPASRNLAT